MVRVCLSASACLGGIRECMIKSERETGNDARLQKKDKLLLVLIFTVRATKNGPRSEAPKGWG